MSSILGPEAFGTDGGGHHRDSVGKGFEDLDPSAAAVADRHRHQVSAGQFWLHGRDAARDDYRWRVVKARDPPVCLADQSHCGPRLAGANAGCDLFDDPPRPFRIWRIPEGALE